MSFFLDKNLGLRLNLVQALEMALSQSELGSEQATPNPCVGSVILDSNDSLVGLGYHKKFGEAHAEVEAFSTLDLTLSDADNPALTVIVTLEPCAHEGKTSSCAKMLVSKKIERVIYLVKDPNELVSGQGHEILEAAGVKTYCIEDLLNGQKLDQPDSIIKSINKNKRSLKKIINRYRFLNRHFFFAINSDLPYITLKWAQTIDGTLGLTDKRLLITNKDVQKKVHHLRACHNIVLVGANTVIKDNPKLDNRFGSSKKKLNVIAVLDPDLQTLKHKENLEIFKIHKPENLIFITHLHSDIQDFEQKGYCFINVGLSDGNEDALDLIASLKLLKAKYKINSVFIEGGIEVFKNFLEKNLFNEIYVFSAPKLSFSKKSMRLSYLKWLKFAFSNLKTTRISLIEENFLVRIFKK